MQYYLRLEGVNLNNFVYDTNDLSTIRGGGLLLLRAMDTVQRQHTLTQLKPISTGASSGLFLYEVPGEVEAENVRQDVERILNTDVRLKHATFVVDITPKGKDFVQDRETLLARNRWRQMQQPTVAVPEHNTRHRKPAVCKVDRVRTAVETMPGPTEPLEAVSASVKARREWGRTQKQEFYKQQTQISIPREFAQNFDELTADTQRGNLHHKMAVIYLDGNGFGALRNDKCTSSDKEKAFDDTLTGYQREALTALLHTMESESWISQDRCYRVETLLWGGDEIIWVVPAWCGWETLSLFYRESAVWTFEEEPLTHAAGMVFCHHNAPIYRISALAKNLAERVKDQNRAEKHSTNNRLAYQVLESFDHIGRDLDTFLRERYGSPQALMIAGSAMSAIEQAMRHVKEGFPRSKLHWIVQNLRPKPDAAKQTLDETVEKLDPMTRYAWEKLQEHFNDTQALCFNVAELWDYVALQA